ncbi:MAG: tRNA epoxyqueuosine(34) reductase QueG [Sedimentibacter sp.]|uniref:tRNA epoxyqueuosine(34) reductase QueG n=1 Tax=Sedimentibacter sp. TaxID=1960295 RepID=UPI002981F592|nr:tRNA epoxyqueuosine(34) reductase QueG [Sedimentibacter sp.]MDW5300094.1 tRNA epoxyqueuosine(34) reductase QueG [Sedimentibacter sp.]
MKQIITDIAKNMGIDIIGFTQILDYSYLSELLFERERMGFNSEFEERDINKRLDVRCVFPKCKSIIAIGVPYAQGYKKPVTSDKGLLSVVSYGEDYHKKLELLLNNLAIKIKKHINFEYVSCVDTSPLIDREICKNAGIGQYGKNSLLINDNYGSFINLGYLLTDIEIKSNKTVDTIDICKDCDICVKSCPNNAILKNGGIDSKRCISNLTQTRNYIPIEYRHNMGNQIYGCDICQIVCPKNKKNLEIKSNIDNNYLMVDLKELLKISKADFNKKYGSLSGSWRGKNIWKRNALISIGNLGLLSMFDMVKEELENPSEMIKIYASWTLMKLNRQKASEILNNNLKYENDIIKMEYIKLLEGKI